MYISYIFLQNLRRGAFQKAKMVGVELKGNVWYNNPVKEVSYELWQTIGRKKAPDRQFKNEEIFCQGFSCFFKKLIRAVSVLRHPGRQHRIRHG